MTVNIPRFDGRTTKLLHKDQMIGERLIGTLNGVLSGVQQHYGRIPVSETKTDTLVKGETKKEQQKVEMPVDKYGKEVNKKAPIIPIRGGEVA